MKIEDGATANTVGGTAAGARNVISGNGGNGVHISNSGTSQNVVVGNYIGTDVTGTTATGKDNKPLGNASNGVKIDDGATANTIGGTDAGSLNLISGNLVEGVAISDPGTSQNVVEGDYIGTDVTGKTAKDGQGNSLGNAGDGVGISNGATANTIGGTVAGSLNVISGNTLNGVKITDAGTSQNLIAGDYIGTDATGATAKDAKGNSLGNGANGVEIDSDKNTIGALATGMNPMLNVISGNTNAGIYLGGDDNLVLNSYVGTDATGAKNVGNGVNGINVTGGSNTIGGVQAGSLNLISGNGAPGEGTPTQASGSTSTAETTTWSRATTSALKSTARRRLATWTTGSPSTWVPPATRSGGRPRARETSSPPTAPTGRAGASTSARLATPCKITSSERTRPGTKR